MELFKLSRLNQLDVKWTGLHRGNHPLADYEHTNPYFELIMVTEGPIFFQLDDRRLELSSGDCLLLKPWERHTAWKLTHEQASFFWVQFFTQPGLTTGSLEELQSSLSESLFEKSKQELRTDSSPEAEHLFLPRHGQPVRRFEALNLFEKLHQEMERPHGYFRYRASLLLGQILHLIAEDTLNQSHGPAPVPAAFTTYRHIVNYLNENYAKDLIRAQLETLLDRNYEYLCQVFKKYAGMSMLTYVHRLRIQRAKHLLMNSSLEIKTISEAVGFQDPYYFSRLFKRFEGVNPTDYRKSHPVMM
ncbi:AraC family transcriptional regulator [Gorillibacterium sp. sgz5001074]|uniref:helix-turn-helix domain-containing protein n=1 Tax=Gorillibacterium sp. sgz5001074 TaxID=3446695 RepID=UPI003F674225